MVRERQATRTYTESEALDLSVRNLTSEWRPEIRRLVERDKRTGLDGTLPFKLSLAQLATTFVEYASEIGRDPPSSQHPPSGRTPTSIIRRIETASPDFSSSTSDATLDDEEINLMVRAISQNQDASSVCLGCQLPGHKLEDCNRFVDYIVAEGLAQRNPQLKAQIANSHKQFRSRLNSANTRNRPPLGANNRVMHRILEDEPANIDVAATNDDDDDGDKEDLVGYQQNSPVPPLKTKSTLKPVSKPPTSIRSPFQLPTCFLPFPRPTPSVSTLLPIPSCFVGWPRHMIVPANSRSHMLTTDPWLALPTIATFVCLSSTPPHKRPPL
ncbi:hypothetical protein MHU86_2335 [Fragilaria crotonensis]|nr:hypothetical protein MHU86_2335 [Fragilaria crotonensis]